MKNMEADQDQPRPSRIVIEVAASADGLFAGEVLSETSGEKASFVGWLELLQLLEAATGGRGLIDSGNLGNG